MGVLLEIHYVVAFLLILCALVFSWSVLGRRVVNVVAALQFLLGLALAGVAGANHIALPPLIWVHMLGSLLVLGAYGMAMRFGRRAGGARPALAFSIAGCALVLLTFYLGLHLAAKV